MVDVSYAGYWIRRFLVEYLIVERGCSKNTQQSYRDTFRLLLPFAARSSKMAVDTLRVEDITPKVVLAFLAHLETERSCAAVTRNQRLATIHAFSRFVGERCPEYVSWCSAIRLIPFKRRDHNPIPYLEKDEMDGILAVPNRGTAQGRRDHAILLFLYNTGARASEAVHVTVEDMTRDSAGAGIVRLAGKGRKVRFCPLWKQTMDEMGPLVRGRTDASCVFLNHCGNALTRFGLHALVDRYAKQAAVKIPSLADKRVSPHTIRHTTATHLLRAGVDINTIRAWLGHVSIETTNIYAETDLAIKAKALSACDPGIVRSSSKGKWKNNKEVMDFLNGLK